MLAVPPLMFVERTTDIWLILTLYTELHIPAPKSESTEPTTTHRYEPRYPSTSCTFANIPIISELATLS